MTPVVLMSTSTIILLVVIAVLVAGLAFLTFWGNKQQKKAEASQQQIEAAAQPMTMLVIDKKKMKLKDAGLPAVVLEQTPKMLRGTKMPIVKAKVGPKVMSLICDTKIFDSIPLKQEVKATISGIYITDYKSLRKVNLKQDEVPKKKGLFGKKKRK